MHNLRNLTSLTSMGGLWAGLAGAVWQRTWAHSVYGIQGITWSSASLRSMNPAGQAAGASLARQVLEEAQHRGVGRVDQVPTLDRVLAAGGHRVGHGVDDLPEGLR
jgi:hypothetical protein